MEEGDEVEEVEVLVEELDVEEDELVEEGIQEVFPRSRRAQLDKSKEAKREKARIGSVFFMARLLDRQSLFLILIVSEAKKSSKESHKKRPYGLNG